MAAIRNTNWPSRTSDEGVRANPKGVACGAVLETIPTGLRSEVVRAAFEHAQSGRASSRVWDLPAGQRAQIVAAPRLFARARFARLVRRPVRIRPRGAALARRRPPARRLVRRAARSPGRRRSADPERERLEAARYGGCFGLPGRAS